MTKRRDSGSFEEAMMKIVKLLGARQAADIVSLSSKTLRDHSDPARAGRPRLAEALKLDIACFQETGQAPLLDAYLLNLANIVGDVTPPVAQSAQD